MQHDRNSAPWRALKGLEEQVEKWANGQVSDGEIIVKLAIGVNAIAQLQVIVAASMVDEEAQIASAKLEAGGFNYD